MRAGVGGGGGHQPPQAPAQAPLWVGGEAETPRADGTQTKFVQEGGAAWFQGQSHNLLGPEHCRRSQGSRGEMGLSQGCAVPASALPAPSPPPGARDPVSSPGFARP